MLPDNDRLLGGGIPYVCILKLGTDTFGEDSRAVKELTYVVLRISCNRFYNCRHSTVFALLDSSLLFNICILSFLEFECDKSLAFFRYSKSVDSELK